MTPPINIDGTQITGASIDGQDVSAITVDGTQVFSAIPASVLLPEDGDLDLFTGDTGSASIVSSPTLTEDRSLEMDGDRNQIISQSGLNRYPKRGEVFSFFIQAQANGGSSRLTIFGAQDGSNNYNVYLRPSGGSEIELQKNGFDINLDSGNASVSVGEWYEYEVEWRASGDIIARLFEVDQSTGERQGQNGDTLSGNDTEYTDGGIGLFSGEDSSTVSNWTGWQVIEEL